MKKLIISASVVAVGAANIQQALADDALAAPSSKIWSVGATLRGFYDSNYAIQNTGSDKGSYGVELSPTVSLNDSLTQTDYGIRYTYGLYWYDTRQNDNQNALDQTHQLDLWMDHAFDERWKLTTSDTFAAGQEPELLGNAGVPYRVNGNNIANHFNTTLDTQWTRELSTSLHYQNDFYDFQQDGGNAANPSLKGLLNRDENNLGIDPQWHFDPETMVFVGYSFDWVPYIGQEQIGYIPGTGTPGTPYSSSYRDTYAQQFYAGAQHNFTPNLSGSIKAGAQYVDSYNYTQPNSTDWSPYGTASLSYTYLPGSYVQVGFSQMNNGTYVTAPNSQPGTIQYEETSLVYGSINHHFTEKLIGSALAQYSYSEFHGSGSLGPDVVYSAGLNLTYIINTFLSADAGYNYDRLRSDVIGAAYERNRFYIGMTATY